MKHIDFYFDFISPYAYLASDAIVAIAERHGYSLAWKPFRLGVAVVKVMGLKPLMETPLKGPYVRKDADRMARALGMPLKRVDHGMVPEPPARAFYAAPETHRQAFARALLQARWRDGLNIAEPAVLTAIAQDIGLESGLIDHALSDPAPRQSWTDATQQALDRGVFGSPTAVVGGELFWGVDRLWLLDSYLEAGEDYVTLDAARLQALGVVPPAT